MIERHLTETLRKRAGEFPVVTLTGPRQSGKTTLVRACFPDYGYANLEDPETRELAENDYRRFFELHPAPLVIDEIQRVPKLASAIQVAVDERRGVPGQYVLTGSHQPLLRQTVTQSLAGRSAFLRLLPLSLREQRDALHAGERSADALILRGGMPELVASRRDPAVYYRAYLQSYLERDVRLLAEIRHVSAFNRFLVLLAGRVGQLLNLESMSGEVGVSHTTLSSWLDVLEASFVVFRLRPWFSKLPKRLVKTPKIYFSETGLAARLLGLRTPDQVSRDPLRGHLFENLVVSDFIKEAFNRDDEDGLFFFRTSDGLEIDLVRDRPEGLQPIEIKSSQTWSKSLAEGLSSFRKLVPSCIDPVLVYAGRTLPGATSSRVVNFLDAAADIR